MIPVCPSARLPVTCDIDVYTFFSFFFCARLSDESLAVYVSLPQSLVRPIEREDSRSLSLCSGVRFYPSFESVLLWLCHIGPDRQSGSLAVRLATCRSVVRSYGRARS